MKSNVYFIEFGASYFEDSILNRLDKLFKKCGAQNIIKKDELIAIKGHFGESGNVSFVSPVYYRRIVDKVKESGGLPFLTDTNTMYVGERNNSVKHLINAVKNGFSYTTLGAPVIISDGLRGTDYVEIEVNQKHIKKAKIASGIYWADSMIVLSHTKMHLAASFGGAIKNIGMGCASRGGKQEQHSGNMPGIDKEKCTGCGECEKWCNFDAIHVVDKKAQIDKNKCAGCGECLAVCRFSAVFSNWDASSISLQEKMVEYAGAVLKNKKDKIVFFNFLINITPDCDCLPSSGKYLVPDIGILASFDPVAIDAASVYLINKAQPIDTNLKGRVKYDLSYKDKDKFKMVYPKLDWRVQIDYAEEIGLGTKEFELIEVK
jgi:uncharacterized Fe-S center protein